MKKKKASNNSIQIATGIKNGKLETTKIEVKIGTKFLLPINPRIVALRTQILTHQTNMKAIDHLKGYAKDVAKGSGIYRAISSLHTVIEMKENIDTLNLYRHIYKEYSALEGFGLGFNESYSAIKIMDAMECANGKGSYSAKACQKDIEEAMEYVEMHSNESKKKDNSLNKVSRIIDKLDMPAKQKKEIAEMLAESETIMAMVDAGEDVTREQLDKVEASSALLEQLLLHVKGKGEVA